MNGFSPIITTASLTHEEFLKSLGAMHVLDRALPDDTILSEIPNLTGGEPVVFAFEAVGRSWSQRLAYAALGKNGGYVSVVPGGDPEIADLIKPDDGKRVRRPMGSFRAPANHALGIELYKRLSGWLANGTLVVSYFSCMRSPSNLDPAICSPTESRCSLEVSLKYPTHCSGFPLTRLAASSSLSALRRLRRNYVCNLVDATTFGGYQCTKTVYLCHHMPEAVGGTQLILV